jgi:regulator-associated protein of mTOR
MATFAMSVIVKNYLPGQEVALQENLVAVCLEQMSEDSAQLRLWIIICLAKLWERYDKARWCGVRDSAHEKLYVYLKDVQPEVSLQ